MHSFNQISFFQTDPLDNRIGLADTTRQFSLVLDHRQWLQFLVDEWFISNSSDNALHLGVNTFIGEPLPPTRHTVVAWIDPSRLTKLTVHVRKGTTWSEHNIWEVDAMAEEVIWAAPLPLFAVNFFSTDSEESRDWLIALSTDLTKGKTGLPPLTSKPLNLDLSSPAQFYLNSSRLNPPADWNSLRGAAAMAAWAIPANEPWFQILANTLSTKNIFTIADKMGEGWIREMPWRPTSPDVQDTLSTKLWRALLWAIAGVNYRSGWKPLAIFKNLVEQAVKNEAAGDRFEEFLEETYEILNDRGRIHVQRGLTDPVGLIIQLILLRPTADRFVTWKDELSSMPPVVWWAGATISGYITGFRDLEPRFSGLPEGRKLLALRTWQLANLTKDEYWKDELTEQDIEWEIDDNSIKLTCAGIPWAERTENSRGKWYRADFANEQVRRTALDLAEKYSPHCLKNSLPLKNTSIGIRGDGHLSIQKESLSIEGHVELELPIDISLKRDLRDDDFRNWLVWGGIEGQLPLPPVAVASLNVPTSESSPRLLFTDVPPEETIPGLVEVQNFLSYDEEQDLVKLIDSLPWQNSLARRVQHYGWEYDYKSAAVNPSSKIGPLPIWAQDLALRLLDRNLIPEVPDQVIVNEYLANQGISKHIDSSTSFVGPVITISLLESWEMVFRHPNGKKITRVLERGSAVILNGPARYEWTHEIPKRIKERWGTRGRRISLTFRKVNLEAVSYDKRASAKRNSRAKIENR